MILELFIKNKNRTNADEDEDENQEVTTLFLCSFLCFLSCFSRGVACGEKKEEIKRQKS
jgi:hypothetical protein